MKFYACENQLKLGRTFSLAFGCSYWLVWRMSRGKYMSPVTPRAMQRSGKVTFRTRDAASNFRIEASPLRSIAISPLRIVTSHSGLFSQQLHSLPRINRNSPPPTHLASKLRPCVLWPWVGLWFLQTTIWSMDIIVLINQPERLNGKIAMHVRH